MGLKPIGLDIAKDKLELALSAGAEQAVNALDKDAVERVLDITGGGAQGVLVTAVSTPAFAQGAEDGPPQGHGQPGRTAARRISDADLRCRAETHHRARIDRGHAAAISTRRSPLPRKGR
jgi:hypothetical protein